MKKLLIGIVALFAFIIIGLVIAISMVNLNKYKPQIEQAVKEHSGYELKINGDIGTSFSPIGISIENVIVKNPEIKSKQEIMALQKIGVAVELMPLLSKEIKVKYITLNNLSLDITKFKNGKFNFEVTQPSTPKAEKEAPKQEKSEAKESTLPKVNISEVRLKNANINFEDLKTKSKATVQDINVAIDNIGYDASKKGLNALSFEANTQIKAVIFNQYKIKDISVDLDLKDAIANLKNLKLTMYDSLATAKGKLDLNKKVPYLEIEADVPDFKLANFSKEYIKKDILSGSVSVHKKFTLSLGDMNTIKRTLNGVAIIDGKDVGIKGFDLDKILSGYDKAKNVDLTDVGASLVAGPLGFLLSKSSDMSGIYGGANSGTTLLKHLHIETKIAKGIADLSDVAMATGKNRVAIKGQLNLINERFLNVQLGVLEANNCAKFSQTIEGTFSKPSVKVDESMISTVTNMATSLFGKISGVVAPAKKENKKCSVFYNGVVKQP
ncbi:AsmA family protein [Sulfurospirillum sp. 1612]|uniref:AsmA family protein n=1 Tax=Sulfurospirillum sp. 1612 TaxID=3094835 RepID=UPI002F928C02